MFDIEGHPIEMPVDLLVEVMLLILWVFVQVVFALYYAHIFYGRSTESSNSGFVFPNNPLPDYWDFTCFAFVIGMRIRAPRVQVTTKKMRRVVLAHSVASFVFNVSILMLAVDIVIRRYR